MTEFPLSQEQGYNFAETILKIPLFICARNNETSNIVPDKSQQCNVWVLCALSIYKILASDLRFLRNSYELYLREFLVYLHIRSFAKSETFHYFL